MRAPACLRTMRLANTADLPLAGDTVVDDHTVAADAATQSDRAEPGDAANTPRVRDRRLAADAAVPAVAAASSGGDSRPLTTQDLAAAFASFAVAGVGTTPMPQLAASTASIVAPRRPADAGQGELRTSSASAASPPAAEQPATAPPSAAVDDAAAQAAYTRMLAEWNAQQSALSAAVRARPVLRTALAVDDNMCPHVAQVAKQAATQLQVQKDQTALVVRQLADEMVQNISANKAWCVQLLPRLLLPRACQPAEIQLSRRACRSRQDTVQMQVQSLDQCQVIIHKPIFIAPKFDPGGCEPPSLQPGTPPTYTKGTPGTWTPGRAAYFTPGYWTVRAPKWISRPACALASARHADIVLTSC